MAYSKEIELDILRRKKFEAYSKTQKLIREIMETDSDFQEELLSLCVELKISASEEEQARKAYDEALKSCL